MEQFNSYKIYFTRTKLSYTAIFFSLHILYRMLGCSIVSYLCGQSLDFFVPVFVILVYYITLLVSKSIIKKLGFSNLDYYSGEAVLFDFFAENLFYITTAVLIYIERWYPYYCLRTSIIILVDLVFAFFIFRRGFVSRYGSTQDNDEIFVYKPMWFVTIVGAVISFFIIFYILEFLLIMLGLISG